MDTDPVTAEPGEKSLPPVVWIVFGIVAVLILVITGAVLAAKKIRQKDLRDTDKRTPLQEFNRSNWDYKDPRPDQVHNRGHGFLRNVRKRYVAPQTKGDLTGAEFRFTTEIDYEVNLIFEPRRRTYDYQIQRETRCVKDAAFKRQMREAKNNKAARVAGNPPMWTGHGLTRERRAKSETRAERPLTRAKNGTVGGRSLGLMAPDPRSVSPRFGIRKMQPSDWQKPLIPQNEHGRALIHEDARPNKSVIDAMNFIKDREAARQTAKKRDEKRNVRRGLGQRPIDDMAMGKVSNWLHLNEEAKYPMSKKPGTRSRLERPERVKGKEFETRLGRIIQAGGRLARFSSSSSGDGWPEQPEEAWTFDPRAPITRLPSDES